MIGGSRREKERGDDSSLIIMPSSSPANLMFYIEKVKHIYSTCKMIHITLIQSNSLSRIFRRGRVKLATGSLHRDFTIPVAIS